MPLVGDSALALIQTPSGYLTNVLDAKTNEKSCEDATNYLSRKFAGKPLGEMMKGMELAEQDMQDEIKGFKEVIDTLIEGIKRVIEEKHLDIKRAGSIDMLESRGDGEQTKKVLKLLEDKNELEKALQLEDNELSVTLVDESEYSGLALVKAPLCIDGTPIASIGVLGPQRMDYGSIASALKVIMNELKGDKDEKQTKS